MGYLAELIYGEDANDSENRLSRIFSATFNHSAPFRKAILGLLQERYFPTSTASTQVSYRAKGEKCVIDILLKHKNKTLAIIENKIDATLTAAQLKIYNQIRELKNVRKRFCFVKSTNPGQVFPASWEIIYWHDVHSLLLKKCPNDFFSQNFVEILEEHKMITPQKITKTELTKLAKLIHQLRYAKKPDMVLDSQVFETANKFNAMLGELWIMAKKDDLIRKRIGHDFRCSPFLGWWSPEEAPIRGHHWNAWMGGILTLAKAQKKIKSISTGLWFSEDPGWYKIRSDALDKNAEWVGEWKEYKKRDIVFADWSKQVLSFWRRKLS
jgi:hypothetical protein